MELFYFFVFLMSINLGRLKKPWWQSCRGDGGGGSGGGCSFGGLINMLAECLYLNMDV
jgi:hypothetical protein